MPRQDDPADPRGLIYESFRIDGIGEPECRSIFLDWAIGVPLGEDSSALVRKLLGRFGAEYPDHPMTSVLTEALNPPAARGRRGGAMARRKQD
ncbi:hypothetical protein [Boseongicola aestuarii]|jgi:hypothetical protein|uniref:Uncharacterized protein n=1 Tax=Boseongicola aestuarii TaxID=1470561 RepID=A0A238IWM9_9RHOB|nr:hypothetical protein [Boseongicola aestuarii]SMX22441.1 hypothetical protein BOA8489_00537 [Boseongicola aestuarii]